MRKTDVKAYRLHTQAATSKSIPELKQVLKDAHDEGLTRTTCLYEAMTRKFFCPSSSRPAINNPQASSK